MIVLDKFRGGRELVPGRELVHHHYSVERDLKTHSWHLVISNSMDKGHVTRGGGQ